MRVCPQCQMQHPDDVTYCASDGTRLTAVDAAACQPIENGLGAGCVLGSYRLESLLGEGGMGFVYLAEHTRLGRRVALKMLRREYANNPAAVRRFFGEARSVNQINHENIVEITDFIEDPGGDNYYIMELLEGQNLGHMLSDEGGLPVQRMLTIAMQVAKALAAVHSTGIIHRDLKSENIFLVDRGDRRDYVKLLDFGLAKLMDRPEGQALNHTIEGAILGTPEYMSPEQAAGKKVDHRTDIYSLGVVLYEMAAGRKPFTDKSFGDLVVSHMTVMPIRPSKLKDLPIKLPRKLEQLIMQCLEKNPDKRPQTMDEVVNRLRGIGQSESVQLDAYQSLVPTPARSRALTGALLALLLILGAGALWWTKPWQARQADGAPADRPDPNRSEAQLPPSQVVLTLESDPPGAQIIGADTDTHFGQTPANLAFDRADATVALEFRLKDYRSSRQELRLDADRRLLITLAKAPPAKPAGHKRRKTNGARDTERPDQVSQPPLDRDSTIDPFGDD